MKTLLAILALSFLATAARAQAPYWEQLAGPYGGMIKTLVIDSSGTFYAGSWQGGIYRSTDNGATWRTSDTFTLGFRIGGMAAAPNGHLFLATSGSYNNVTEPVRRIGFYRSTDHGDSWQLTPPAVPSIYPTAAAVAPNGDVYMGSFDGTFRSTDEGATWKALGGTGSGGFVTGYYVAPDGRVFYTTSELSKPGNFGYYDPVKGGKKLTVPGNPQSVFSVVTNAQGHIFAGASNGLHRSTDSGATWTTLKLTTQGTISDGPRGLVIDAEGRIYAAVANAIFISSDNGATWTRVTEGLLHRDVRTMVVSRVGTVFAASWGDGVYKSDDHGAHWSWTAEGMRNAAVRAIAVAPNGHIFAGGQGSGLSRSTDGGATWQRLPRNLEYISSVIARPDGSILSAGPYTNWGDASPYISTDDGDTWQPLMRGAPYGAFMAYNKEGDLFFANSNVVYRKRAADTTYKESLKTSSISDMAIDSTGRIYVATNGGGLFISADNGETWPRSPGISATASLHAVAAGKDEAYLIDGVVVMRSTDGGITWSYAGAPFTNLAVALSVDRNGHLYVGSLSNGVLHSSDHGVTWDTLSAGFTTIEFRAFAYDLEGRLLAGSESGGIFRSLMPSSSVPGDPIAERIYPLLPAIEPGYPNPTSSAVMLGYTLASSGHVAIELYDMRGAFIRTLLDAEQSGGRHEIAVDVSDLPAGTYTCQLRAGSGAAARMIVVER